MSIIIKKDKGKGKAYSTGIGNLTANLSNKHKKMTIEEIANQLLIQDGLENGEIEIIGVEFSIYRGK